MLANTKSFQKCRNQTETETETETETDTEMENFLSLVYENTTERSKDKSNKMLIWVLNE